MVLSKRIIPCLDVDQGRVVKGVNFVNIKDAGDPAELALKYYEMGADEICFLDITASHEARKTTYEIVSKTAKQIFIPLTVGGGVNSVSDVEKLLLAGADKVAINSGAVKNPELINEASKCFGKQCIVAAVDVKKVTENEWHVFTMGGRHDTGLDGIEWIKELQERGAGELLLTSMDGDGSKQGYDIELTTAVAKFLEIPMIASGGAGKLEHITDVLKSGADAALLASMLHYGETTVGEIKDFMNRHQIHARAQNDSIIF
jgi:cyclase